MEESMSNEATSPLWDDRQLYLAAETMIVARFGVDAVYAELKRIRNDTRKAAMTEATRGNGATSPQLWTDDKVDLHIRRMKRTESYASLYEAGESLWMMRDEYQAALAAQAAEHAAALERIAELEQYAKNYTGFEAAPCLFCEYDNGVLLKECGFHKVMFQTERVAELEQEREQLLAKVRFAAHLANSRLEELQLAGRSECPAQE